MNTLIENLNALMIVKKELNEVLVDHDQPGGQVFDTYPEQFRELFRVLEDKMDDIEEGPYATYEPETVVAKPTIGFENNVVTLTCATQGAEIHFKTKDIYGNIKGDSNYVNRFSINRDTWVETYAILNGVRSSEPDNSRWCYYQAGGSVPAPEFDRTNGIVTITCRQQNAQIWWRILPSTEFVLYTDPELVDGTKWLEAYAVYQGKGSETAISEGTEEGITVADPVLTCSDNIVTITCATEDAVIWYKTNLDDEWTVYTEPIEISVDTEFTAYAYKEGNISNTVTESFEYEEPYVPPVVVPADPVFSISNNVVTITCSTSGATIYYREVGDVEWTEYSVGITISEDTDFEAYSELNGETSDTVVYSAEYEEPQPETPADPVFSTSENVVTITCSTSGATIYYSTDGGNTYNPYSTGITISQNTDFKAYSELDGETSDIVSYSAVYVPPVPADPVITCINNVVTITCSTIGATIWYKNSSSDDFAQYTGSYTIYNSITVYAKSIKNNIESNIVSQSIQIPNVPSISIDEDVVTITCSTSDAIIYYSTDGGNTYSVYSNPIIITTNTTFYSYSRYNNNNSSTTTYNAIYNEYNISLNFKILSNGTVGWKYYDTYNMTTSMTIQYNKNNTGWTNISSTSSGRTISVRQGDTIKFRGNNSSYYHKYDDYNYYYNYFTSTCNFNVSGNIMSLLNYNFNELTTLSSDYTFKYLFKDCSQMINASNLLLPATTLTNYCYQSIFYGCSNLISVPELPATTLTDGCYANMFWNCSSLTTAPELPATTLAYECYAFMFDQCSSLTTAPELPATTLVESCYYYMFYYCTSLTTAPELPVTTLIDRCYSGMFLGCSNLNYIKCLATDISATACIRDWVNEVQTNSGTFIKASGTTWPTATSQNNYSGVPNNWTVQDAA